MIAILPFLVFVPPLAVTLFGGRTAWVWGALFLTTAILYGLGLLTATSLKYGGAGWPLEPLFGNNENVFDTTTFFYLREISRLALTLIVSAIPALLFCLPAHPRRAGWDLLLFWLFALLVFAHLYAPAYLLGSLGMPRRYVEYDSMIATATGLADMAGAAALATLAIASLRPIWSYLKQKMA